MLQGQNVDSRVQIILPESPVGLLQQNNRTDQRLQLLLPGSDENILVPRIFQFNSNFTDNLMKNLQDDNLYSPGGSPSVDSYDSGQRDSLKSSNNLSSATPKEDIAHQVFGQAPCLYQYNPVYWAPQGKFIEV